MSDTNNNTATANNEAVTVEQMNKKISRSIFFKDRMIAVNDQLKEGKTEKEVELTTFEIELRAREGNHVFVKLENGAFVKLFSWDLIKRSVEKIKRLREEKAALVDG